MKITLNIEKRFAYIIIGILIVVLGDLIVYSYGGTQPAVIGHTWGEIICDDNMCVNTTTGNVGIGITNPQAKLDIAGEIKIGNTGLSCDSSNEGALRYNSITNKIEYCNRNSWKEIGNGGTDPCDTNIIFHSCKELYDSGCTQNGYYSIDPDGYTGTNPPMQVRCDMVTDGGGWTIIDPNLDNKWRNYFTAWGTYSDGSARFIGDPNSYHRWSDWFTLYDASKEFRQSPNCVLADGNVGAYRMTGNYYGCRWYNNNCDFNGVCRTCHDGYNTNPSWGTCPWLHAGMSDRYPYDCHFEWWNSAPSLGSDGTHCVAYR